MTTIIAKNTTGGNLFIDDLGIDLGTDSTTELSLLFPVYRISESLDLRDRVSSGDVIINNGSSDLSVSDGLDHLLLETEYEDDLSKRNAWDSQTNEPSTEDYSGWLDTNESILYSYNSIRNKWLSIDRRILTFHKEGEVNNEFMRIGGDLATSNNGYLLERNATLIEVICRSTSGPTDAQFKVFENSDVVYNRQLEGSLYIIDTTADVDLSGGSIIKCQALGGTQQLDWFYDDWQYRKKITIDSDQISGSSSLTNFPVLIYMNSSDLNKARSDGYDILFASQTDSTTFIQLDHEIESFNQSNGILWAWVRIPSLPATEDTDIYMYYGNIDSTNQQNVEAVWNSNYVMVQHLSASTALSQDDSTQNDNDVTTEVGDPTYEQTGKIDSGISFDGNDAIEAPDSASLDITNQVTISAWINPSSITDWNRIVAKSHTSNSNPYTRYGLLFDNADHLRMEISNGTNQYSTNGSTIVQTGQWQYATATFDGSALRVYYNGSQDGITNQTTTITTNDMPLSIARSGFAADYFTGSLDEVRVSNIARSSDWIATEYSNQNSPQNFYSVGDEQERITTAPTVNPLTQLTIAWRK